MREYRIPRSNVIHLGDEIDAYNGSRFPKDPSAPSAQEELVRTRGRLREWAAAFPVMRLCISNHGLRWAKKAAEAGIPAELLRPMPEVLETPPGWVWRKSWLIETKHPFLAQHGHTGPQGAFGHRQKAILNGVSTVHGHLHASAAISFVRTELRSSWGMNCGSLIDVDAIAFRYESEASFKPWIGCGVVLDDGRMPVLVPYG